MSTETQVQTTSSTEVQSEQVSAPVETNTQSQQEAKPAQAQQIAETVSDGSQKGEAAKPSDDKKQTEIQYDLKLSENSLLDPAKVDEIKAYAKSKNLSPEQAQDLLNREEALLKSFVNEQQEEIKKASEEWKKQALLDKEIGGENFNKNVEFAHRAMKRFGNETLTKYLDESGLGNHPDVIRMFMKIGQAMAEDKIIGSNSQGGQKKSLEEVFYGKQN